jgi:hypothetical protein
VADSSKILELVTAFRGMITRLQEENVKTINELNLVTGFIAGTGARVIIFGEHYNQVERGRINDHIRRINELVGVNFILSEEIGEQVLSTLASKRSAIDRGAYSVSKDSIELSIELNIPMVGIDDWTNTGNDLSTPANVAIREKRMNTVIGNYLTRGVIVVIVTDIHLRKSTTSSLGPASPIWTKYRTNRKVVFVRSQNPKIP